MKIAGVEIPQTILEAQQEGRLVIFAGAGVSIPPPSDLPSFSGLADQLAAGIISREVGEPLDRFLGRVENAGGSVHAKAVALLTKPDSQPNPLHEGLLDLFRRPTDLRVVTTNFDHHFETLVRSRWPGAEVPVHSAPALPYGDDFAGLVYLHGKATTGARLVLTDQDFGRAYLTRAWATRFLQNLFESYVVLFVGYSHDDVVMNYVARGLPERIGQTRYALVPESHSVDNWRYRGIEASSYPCPSGTDHSALLHVITSWADLTAKGALEREQEIQQLVERSPEAITTEEEEYLLYCLSNSSWAQYFYRHANRRDWLAWAERLGVLASLFDATEDHASLVDLADWFCQEPLGERGELACRIASLHTKGCNPQLWSTLSHRLWIQLREESDKTEGQIALIARWLSVLIRLEPPRMSWMVMGYWLEEMTQPSLQDALLTLLRTLTQPVIGTEEGFLEPEAVRYKLTIRGESHSLSAFASKVGTLHSEEFTPELLEVCLLNLNHAHRDLRLVGQANPHYDTLSYGTTRIDGIDGDEDAEASLRYEPILVLVELARQAIDYLSDSKSVYLQHRLLSALKLPAPLVRRICIYGIWQLKEMDAAKKMELVIEEGWLDNHALRPETFALLAACYSDISEDLRIELLDEAEAGFRREDDRIHEKNPDSEQHAPYEMFNLLTWLRGADPSCKITEERLAALQAEHPDFGVREHPDLTHYSFGGGFVKAVSPHAVEVILQWTPSTYLEKLEEVREARRRDDPLEDSVRGFFEKTTEAISSRPEWGAELGRELARRERWEDSTWTYIFRGWEKAPHRQELLEDITSLLTTNTQIIEEHPDGPAELLEEWSKGQDSGHSKGFVSTGVKLARVTLKHTSDSTDDLFRGDWLQLAINRPSGRIAQFVVHALGSCWKEEGKPDSWKIPKELRPLLRVLVEERPLGRTVLGSQLHFLLGLDTNWTEKRLLPWFSWAHDKQGASQVWNGFTTWGRPSPTVREKLLPHLVETFGNLECLDEGSRRRLPTMVAWFAYAAEGESRPWMADFLRSSNDEDRAVFADHVATIIKQLGEDERDRLWNSWLRRYLEERIQGPPELESREKVEFVDWCKVWPENLPQLVPILTTTTPPVGEPWRFLDWSRDENLPDDKDSFAQLILWLLSGQRRENFFGYEVHELRNLLESLRGQIRDDLYRRLVESYSELGGQGASALLDAT